jgi:hypothetical protein
MDQEASWADLRLSADLREVAIRRGKRKRRHQAITASEGASWPCGEPRFERIVSVCALNVPPIFWAVGTLHSRCTRHSFIILLCDRAKKISARCPVFAATVFHVRADVARATSSAERAKAPPSGIVEGSSSSAY